MNTSPFLAIKNKITQPNGADSQGNITGILVDRTFESHKKNSIKIEIFRHNQSYFYSLFARLNRVLVTHTANVTDTSHSTLFDAKICAIKHIKQAVTGNKKSEQILYTQFGKMADYQPELFLMEDTVCQI